MANNDSPFRFKQFQIRQDRCAMKVGTDGVLLGAWAAVEGARAILDIGSGTGLLSLMAAQRNALAMIVGVEIDAAAVEQAQDNVSLTPWAYRVRMINSPIQHFPKGKAPAFGHIISNPPYFKSGKGVSSPSPRRRKARETDELSHTALLRAVKRLLAPDGRFSLILPYAEGEAFIKEASEHGLHPSRVTPVKGKAEKPVGRLLMEFSRQPVADFVWDSPLVVQHGGHNDWTAEYVELTKDFHPEL